MKFPGFGVHPKCFFLLVALACSAEVLSSAPSEPTVEAKDLPRVAPVEPAHALETFQIKPGFRIEAAATEPLVVDPVAMSFDENGRLFVAEMRDYSERRDEALGRIRLLTDTDGDGRFDKSVVFAEHLPWPTAVICYGGGVFVASTPDIIFLKDTDGDGVADVREVVITGFANGVERINVQQLVNSLNWGLDNRIHGANGGNNGTIRSLKRPNDPAIELRGRDFSFDPQTLELRAESGGGQYGFSFDDQGRKFVCSNSSHVRAIMFDERYASRNPFYSPPAPVVDIAVDGPAAEVYRISPDEPWRVLRTRWRVAGLVPGPVEGGGRASGYFTSATGITIYRGDVWPEDFSGNAFVADCGSNLVHRKKISATEFGLKAERPADEQKVEFLASRDLWFRPVQMANGPDGNLYVIDMYREVIEHPWSFPASIKKLLDLNSGNDRGRIYRVAPEGTPTRPLPRLGQASVQELVQTLAHPNGWHRDTAARLLFERQDLGAVPALVQTVRESKVALARMHALYALNGLQALKVDQVQLGLADGSPWVRKHAVRLAEPFLRDAAVGQALVPKLRSCVNDPDPEVRRQLASSIGDFEGADRVAILRELVHAHATDPGLQVGVLSSLASRAGEFFTAVSRDAAWLEATETRPFLRQLVLMIGAHQQRAELEQVMEALGRTASTPLACTLGSALGEGLQRAGSSLAKSVDPTRFAPLITRARALAADSQADVSNRSQAVRLLAQARLADVRGTLTPLLRPGQPVDLQKAALTTFASYSDPEVASDLLGAWPELTPTLRSDTVEALLRRPERLTALLEAIETGKLRRSDLSTSQVEFLRKRPEPAVRERASQLLGRPAIGTRQEVVNRFSSALSLQGDAEKGAALYSARCATCHRLAGEGHALGPDLETVRSSGKEILLANILDPNREVMPKYVNYLAETADGESVTGLVAQESDSAVVLRQPNDGQVTLLRSNIAQLRSLGQSVMPEGLEEGLKAQDLADLMEYILTAKVKIQ